MKKGIYITLGVLFGLAVIGSFMEEDAAVSEHGATQSEVVQVEERQAPEPIDAVEPERKWYEGGTLHNANALEWQVADYENKLATAGDFVASVYSNEMFNAEIMRSINNMADMRYIAEELVVQMDDFTAPDEDPELNRQMYVNQEVRSMVVMVMMMAGWTR